MAGNNISSALFYFKSLAKQPEDQPKPKSNTLHHELSSLAKRKLVTTRIAKLNRFKCGKPEDNQVIRRTKLQLHKHSEQRRSCPSMGLGVINSNTLPSRRAISVRTLPPGVDNSARRARIIGLTPVRSSVIMGLKHLDLSQITPPLR